MKNRLMKQMISFVLCAAMVLGNIPATVFAAEHVLCAHHPEHTDCSYVAAVASSECTHQHDDTCYTATEACIHVHEDCGTEENPCDHACSSETGCVTSQLNCGHVHNAECGYAEGTEGTPCDFVCADCAEDEAESVVPETTVNDEPDAVCTCESDDPACHAPFCKLYVMPENPTCYCVEKCAEDTANALCDVCYFNWAACGGSEEDAGVPFDVETSEPVIHSITVDKKQVSSGDSVTVTMHVTDESELDQVYIRFDTPHEGVTNTVDVDLVEGQDGIYTGTLTVDDSFVCGLYTVYVVVAQDIHSNRNQLSSYDSVYFEVTSNEGDLVAPVIEYVSLDKDKINAGESVTVTMKVTDESELGDVYVRFDTPFAGVVKTLDVDLTEGADGLYRGTVTTDDSLPSGNYYAYVIVAEDIHGNRNQISNDKSVCFELVNGGVETNRPVINSITLDKTQVQAGETVTVTVDVTDESDLQDVHVFIGTPLSGAGNEIIVYLSANEDGSYSGTIATDSTFSNGTYFVSACVARDIYGNREQISAKDVTFQLTGGYEDTKVPEIGAVSFDCTTVTAGETVTVTAEVTDESELKDVHVFIETPLAGVGNDIIVHLSANGDGTYSGTIPTDSTFSNGTYYVSACVAIDIHGNREQISAKDVTFQLSGGHSEVDAPVINSVTFDRTKIGFNETVTVTADIADESKMADVHIFLTTPLSGAGNDIIIHLSLAEDDLYKGTFALGEQYPFGTYYVSACVAIDIHGNRAQISAQDTYVELGGSKIEINAPEIKNVSVDKTRVGVGDTVTVSMEVTDESPLDLVYVRFDTPHAGVVKTIDVDLTKDDDGIYRGTITTDDSLPYGFYYSYVIVAQDILTNRNQISHDQSLYFELVPDTELTYTVTWKINGEFHDETVVKAGEAITAPEFTVPEGYTFSGWDVPETMPAEDIELDAELKRIPQESTPEAGFTATGYDTGILSNVTAGMQYSLNQGATWVDIAADTVELTGLEPLSEYYDGEARIWVKMPGNGTTTADSEIQKISVYRESKPSNVTAYGYYTITGVNSSMEYKKEGADLWTKVPQNAMSLSDLEVGVYEVRTAAAGKYLASDSVEVTVAGIPVYTITYELYGGTINGEYAAAYTYGEGAQLPTDVTRDQFTFRGWSDSDTVFNAVTEIGTDASGDKTFYAWWEVAPYTVTWTINGEFYAETAVPHMGHIDAPDYLVPLGYTFSGWDIPDMMPAEDIVLDATLEVEAFEVIWNVNGEFYAKTEVKFGETVTAPEYTIPEGHIFSGWDVPETMPAENIELDATLEVGKFKVTWNVDGKITEEEYEYGETIIAPRNPHKAGNRCVSYRFKMWEGYTKGMTMPAEDLEFTAVFHVTQRHKDWNRDHICDRKCGKTDIGKHADSATDRDHRCDYGCGAILEACIDRNGDRNHNCDICRKKNVSEHTYAEATCYRPATCTECGAKHGRAKSHDWNEGRIIKNPTCTRKGVKLYTCESCWKTRTETIEPTGHDYIWNVCRNCGDRKYGYPSYPSYPSYPGYPGYPFYPGFHDWWYRHIK